VAGMAAAAGMVVVERLPEAMEEATKEEEEATKAVMEEEDTRAAMVKGDTN
jgi:hypothetical protein